MKLYLARHGEAFSSLVEPTQPLTPHGIKQAHELAQQLLAEHHTITQIFHSGILRAQQTAELVAETLKVKRISMLEHLQPNDAVDPVKRNLNEWSENTLIIGHLPYLGYMLWSLNEDAADVVFNNTTCVILERNEDNWDVEAVLQPRNS